MKAHSFFSLILTFAVLLFTEHSTAQMQLSLNKIWRPAELISIRLQAQGFHVEQITKVNNKGYLVYLQDDQNNKFIYLIDPFDGHILEKYPYHYSLPK